MRSELAIEPVPAAEWARLAPFIFDRNRADGDVRCVHSHTGDDLATCAAELGALAADESRFFAARDGAELAGVAGAEFDGALGRAWLRGPFAAAGRDFDSVAAPLLEALCASMPQPIVEHAVFVNASCAEALAFFRARRFGDEAPIDELETVSPPKPWAPPAGVEVVPPDTRWRDAIGALHEDEFPFAYVSAAQLFGAPEPKVFTRIALVDGAARGYVRAHVDAYNGQGHVDFVAVAEEGRRRGAGRALLREALHWAFAERGARAVALTVRDDRMAARALYAAEGFTRLRSAIGMRRRFAA